MGFIPTRELSRKVYLFFLLQILDVELSTQLAQIVLSEMKSKLDQSEDTSEYRDDYCLKICFETYQAHLKKIQQARLKNLQSKSEQIPWKDHLTQLSPLQIQIWNRFSRQARQDEISSLLNTKILGFNEEDVSEAQGISLGTLRFRLARATKVLGICAEAET